MADTSPSKSLSTPCRHKTDPTFSQCASLRKIRKPILDLCHCAENATINDFKSLLPDGDISSLTQHNDSDEDDVLAASIIDTSMVSNTSGDGPEQPVNRPYVPFSVEEVSLVTTLDCWSNCNVRIVGKVLPVSVSNHWSLVSIGEEGGPFFVLVDMKLIGEYPSTDSQVQVFGEIQMTNNSNPIILAKFFRNFSSVDIFFYNKALEEMKKHVPHFIDKKKMYQLRSNSVEDID